MNKKGILGSILIVLVVVAAAAAYFWQASRNQAELIDAQWAIADEESTVVVDHEPWQLLLDDYLVTDEEPGVHLFDYGGLIDDGREPLDDYVNSLLAIDPTGLNSSEQKAYWLNLYNAVTVRLIVDNYPVASITTLGSGGVTTFGPWDDKLITVNETSLSLNDVEHGIIRPLYNDYRIHFAVNCASIGCPDLIDTAFQGEGLDQQLDDATAAFLSHPRAVRFDGDQLHLSTLFDWYAVDFGNDLKSVLSTLGKHSNKEQQTLLENYHGKPKYDYDWSLNGYCSVDNACGG